MGLAGYLKKNNCYENVVLVDRGVDPTPLEELIKDADHVFIGGMIARKYVKKVDDHFLFYDGLGNGFVKKDDLSIPGLVVSCNASDYFHGKGKVVHLEKVATLAKLDKKSLQMEDLDKRFSLN